MAIIACGVMVEQARNASSILAEEGIDCTVVDMHTIKPLDTELLSKLADTCGCFVSAEDHSVIGGLGGAISEWLSTNKPFTIGDGWGHGSVRRKRRFCRLMEEVGSD